MRKKRCRASKKSKVVDKVAPCESNKNKDDEQKIIDGLMSAFDSVTLEEAVSAFKLAEGDENKAAEILMDSLAVVEEEDQSTTISCSSTGNFASTSSSGNGSSLDSEVFATADFVDTGVVGCRRKGRFKKKVVGAAVAGTVSTMLGKDYVRSVPKKSSSSSPYKSKGGMISDESCRKEMEQFLYSMLGVECELSMDVVRDVLCQCAYDVDKALNVLLDLSSSSNDPNPRHDNIGDGLSFFGMTDPDPDPDPRDSSDNTMAVGTEASTRAQQLDTEICQNVLESLFKMPNNFRSVNAEHDPSTMNWKNIVKKLSSMQPRSEIKQGDDALPPVATRGGDEYHVLRQESKQQWESMKFCYQKAANAFSNGNRSYASYLSDQGRQHSKMALEADEKASHDIFHVRNKSIENLITIDLHGQHVKQAMRLLKLHLLFGAYVRSVRSFRVITGCGSHGLRKSKLKQSVTHLLTTEGVQWREENSGTLFFRLDGQTEFRFMETDSDTD